MSFTRILVVLSLLLVMTGCSAAEPLSQAQEYRIQSGTDLKIFTTTDLHYLSKSLTDGGPAFNINLANGDGKQLRYSDEMMKAFKYEVKMQRPDMVLISGDLTNNGEKQSHLDVAKHLAEMEDSTGTQIYVIPGNHDLLNPWSREFKGESQYKTDSINPKDFKRIYGPFGYDEALTRDSKSLSYLVTPSDKLWLLMLDTSQYRHNKELRHPQLEGRLSSSTLKWIDKCGELAAQNEARIVAVMHHSLLEHNEFIEKGFTIDDNQKVVNVLVKNRIPVVFSGHIHIQNISSTLLDSKLIHDISNNALSVYPHQFGVLNYSTATDALDFNTSPLHMELWAATQGVTDPNLLHFNSYTEASFRQLSLNRSLKQMHANNSFKRYTEKQLEDMAAVIQCIHKNYFTGVNHPDNPVLTSSEGYKLWLNSPSTPLKNYVLRMTHMKTKNNQSLHLDLP